jgi:hypothetical protein
MLASELASALMNLFTTHGDCPVFHEERGSHDTSPVQSIEVIKQEELPPGTPGYCTTLVPAGTTYFLIR